MSVASQVPPEVFIPPAARVRRLRAAPLPLSAPGRSLLPRALPDHDATLSRSPAAPAAAAFGAMVIDLDRWRHQLVGAGVGGDRPASADPCGRTELVGALAGHQPVRLTRRGIAALASAAVVVAMAVVALAWLSAPAAGSSSGSSARPAAVTVQAGDSLWVIAREVAPGRDPRAEVAFLRQLNHLSSDALTPGQSLRIR